MVLNQLVTPADLRQPGDGITGSQRRIQHVDGCHQCVYDEQRPQIPFRRQVKTVDHGLDDIGRGGNNNNKVNTISISNPVPSCPWDGCHWLN